MKLSKLAEALSGRLVGSGDIDIHGAAPLTEAEPDQLSFLALHSYREQALSTRAGAILVVAEIEGCPAAQILCSDPYLSFAKAMRLLYPSEEPSRTVSDLAFVSPDAVLGEGVTIHPFAVIEKGTRIGRNSIIYPHVYIGPRAVIGENCIIHSHVSIREDCVLGNRVILQNGVRIGSDGYGFAKDSEGHHIKIPQIGKVEIGDDVEIGANSCIDRATLSATKIGNGTKLDNLVQIGHNVTVGRDCLLVAQVGIAGSTQIGNHVTLAGQVGISGHLNIGDGSTVGGQSGVTRDIPPMEVYTGYPAIPHDQWAILQRALKKLLEKESIEREREEEHSE